MAHVWAARALLPAMRERGEGYLLNTASAAGLLTNLGLLPYSVTKHAAVGVAEWLAITYGDDGIRVSCLCPQLVDTPLAAAIKSEPVLERAMAAAGELLSPAEVAAIVVDAIGREEFLILPHPEVRDYATRRAADNERWLRGMRRLWAAVGFCRWVAAICDELRIEGVTKRSRRPCSSGSRRQRTSGAVALVAIVPTE